MAGWKAVLVPRPVPVKLEGKCFISSVEMLAWAKANGCPWDYNTGHTWQQFFSSLPGGRPFYRVGRSYYHVCAFARHFRYSSETKQKEPTPSEAGWSLRRALNRR
jgi:hypothetical protein